MFSSQTISNCDLEVKTYYQWPSQSSELLCMEIPFSNKTCERRLLAEKLNQNTRRSFNMKANQKMENLISHKKYEMLENKKIMRGNTVSINYLWANPVLKSCYFPSGKGSVRHWSLCQGDNPKLFRLIALVSL